MAEIDVDLFWEKEKEGYISCRKHPEFDLVIWNYTAKAQYANAWNDVTLMARGLITTPNGLIVSRCMKKFFNLDQFKLEIPMEPFKVTGKEDGSMGVSFQGDDGKFYIATRGSFDSRQAIKANKILQEKYPHFPFDPKYTYIFEIICEESHVVIDYGDMEDLILIAVIDTEYGDELNIHDAQYSWPCPLVKEYDGIKDYTKLKELEEENKEGFVLHFESGLRIKVKFESYVKLHYLFTQVNARKIWWYLKTDTPLMELLENVPDELYAWIKSISSMLGQKYNSLYRRTHETYDEIKKKAVMKTPFVVGETLTFKEYQRLASEMNRVMNAHFLEHPELTEFLNIVHSYKPREAKGVLKEAIWKSLGPGDIRPRWASDNDEEV